jgi:hypothetical protein
MGTACNQLFLLLKVGRKFREHLVGNSHPEVVDASIQQRRSALMAAGRSRGGLMRSTTPEELALHQSHLQRRVHSETLPSAAARDETQTVCFGCHAHMLCTCNLTEENGATMLKFLQDIIDDLNSEAGLGGATHPWIVDNGYETTRDDLLRELQRQETVDRANAYEHCRLCFHNPRLIARPICICIVRHQLHMSPYIILTWSAATQLLGPGAGGYEPPVISAT